MKKTGHQIEFLGEKLDTLIENTITYYKIKKNKKSTY